MLDLLVVIVVIAGICGLVYLVVSLEMMETRARTQRKEQAWVGFPPERKQLREPIGSLRMRSGPNEHPHARV